MGVGSGGSLQWLCIYCSHVQGHVRDLNALDPWEWQSLPSTEAQTDGKALPWLECKYWESVQVQMLMNNWPVSIKTSFLLPDVYNLRALLQRPPTRDPLTPFLVLYITKSLSFQAMFLSWCFSRRTSTTYMTLALKYIYLSFLHFICREVSRTELCKAQHVGSEGWTNMKCRVE